MSVPRDALSAASTFETVQQQQQPQTIMADPADAYEQQNVHEVYQQIAGHFSATRYKVCPFAICLRARLTHCPTSHGPSWRGSSKSCLLDQ